MKKKALKTIVVLLGISAIAFLVHQVGWDDIRETMGLVGWGYLLILTYPLLWIFPNTLGWRSAIRHHENIPFWTLVQIRLSGEVFNSLLPSGYVGGEPIKAQLLSRFISLREATSSVLIAKATQSVVFLVYLGLGVTLFMPAGSSRFIEKSAYGALMLLGLGIITFVILLSQRSFTKLSSILFRLTRMQWFVHKAPQFSALDESLGSFYREGRSRFFASMAWHGVAWIAGALELTMILALMGHPVSWHEAWFMSAVAQLATTIGLMVPAGVGLYEGGHYMAAIALGLPPAVGLSAALIRRIREAFWNIIGVLIFMRIERLSPRK